MRIATSILGGIIGLGLCAMTAAAAPAVPSPALPQASNLVPVAAGCGWRFHRNRWGHCVPNRYGYYRPYRYGYPYAPRYFADGHEPWNRPSPGDHVANRLNRQQLRGGYWAY